MRMAKKNDMALVVGYFDWQTINPNGLIVLVLSDPEINDGRYFPLGMMVNQIDLPSVFDGIRAWIPTRCLIPLDPPSDSATLFAAEPADGAVRA